MPEPIVTLAVRVTPRADRNAVTGVRDGSVVLVRVTASPTEGQANKAVLEILASALGVRRGQLELIGGETSREKRVRVTGLTTEQAFEKIRRRYDHE